MALASPSRFPSQRSYGQQRTILTKYRPKLALLGYRPSKPRVNYITGLTFPISVTVKEKPRERQHTKTQFKLISLGYRQDKPKPHNKIQA